MDATIYQIELTLIDEDPAQPRTEFNQESLLELAETIRLRGVKTPISVRPSPLVEGRYIITHGARRFRASVIALAKMEKKVPEHLGAWLEDVRLKDIRGE